LIIDLNPPNKPGAISEAPAAPAVLPPPPPPPPPPPLISLSFGAGVEDVADVGVWEGGGGGGVEEKRPCMFELKREGAWPCPTF
jgi:hypothetical protein